MPPSIQTLLAVMKKGSTDVSADSIVDCAEGIERPSAADRAVVVEALTEVIQFIEVTQLRGGVEGKDALTYPKWKALQARAGKALLKVHQPNKAPIPTLENMDLDL